MQFGLMDQDTMRRRRQTAETYARLADEYEDARRHEDAKRCEGVVARCIQGI